MASSSEVMKSWAMHIPHKGWSPHVGRAIATAFRLGKVMATSSKATQTARSSFHKAAYAIANRAEPDRVKFIRSDAHHKFYMGSVPDGTQVEDSPMRTKYQRFPLTAIALQANQFGKHFQAWTLAKSPFGRKRS